MLFMSTIGVCLINFGIFEIKKSIFEVIVNYCLKLINKFSFSAWAVFKSIICRIIKSHFLHEIVNN